MMSRSSGQSLPNVLEQISQSIHDILTTPIGSRVMRREYGSLLPELIDSPGNSIIALQIKAAITNAILKWETRILPTAVYLDYIDGRHILEIELTLNSTNEDLSLKIPLNFGASL